MPIYTQYMVKQTNSPSLVLGSKSRKATLIILYINRSYIDSFKSLKTSKLGN